MISTQADTVVYRYQEFDRRHIAEWSELQPFRSTDGDPTLRFVQVHSVYQRSRAGGAKAWLDLGDGTLQDSWFGPEVGWHVVAGQWLLLRFYPSWGDHHSRTILRVEAIVRGFSSTWAHNVSIAYRRDEARVHFEQTAVILPILRQGPQMQSGYSTAGFWIGIASFFVSMFGVVPAVGLALSIHGLRKGRSGLGIAAIILNATVLAIVAITVVVFALAILGR